MIVEVRTSEPADIIKIILATSFSLPQAIYALSVIIATIKEIRLIQNIA